MSARTAAVLAIATAVMRCHRYSSSTTAKDGMTKRLNDKGKHVRTCIASA
jgi:hypothetical protein